MMVRGMSRPGVILHICSVFSAPQTLDAGTASGAFDPVGGMQTFTGKLVSELSSRGFHQMVLSAWRPGEPVHELCGLSTEIFRVGLPTRHARQVWAIPATGLALPLARQASVVHVHSGEDLAAIPIAVLAARLSGRPLVVTIHSSVRFTLRAVDARLALLKMIGSRIEHMGVSRADAITVLTRRLRDCLEMAGVPRERIHLVRPGSDLVRIKRADSEGSPRAPTIVFVGRFTRAKGLLTLTSALDQLRCRARVILVGDGPLRRRIGEWSAGQRRHEVQITGFVPHSRVASFLADASLMVLPTLFEEYGIALAEASSYGVPVIASDVGGISEIVKDGRNGLLVPPEDPSSLAMAMDRLLANPAEAVAMGNDGARRFAHQTWARTSTTFESIYETVIDSSVSCCQGRSYSGASVGRVAPSARGGRVRGARGVGE
jgi:glycogen(starch) synthase